MTKRWCIMRFESHAFYCLRAKTTLAQGPLYLVHLQKNIVMHAIRRAGVHSLTSALSKKHKGSKQKAVESTLDK